MIREEFGAWGQELDEKRFWQAVAMLGTSEGLLRMVDLASAPLHQTADGPRKELTAPWRLGDAVQKCKAGEIEPAPFFADAWAALAKAMKVRLHLQEVFENQGELVQTFARAAGATSFSVLPGQSVAADWQWPMRFGFLTDNRSRELQAIFERAMEGSGTVRELQRISSAADDNVFEWLALPGTVDDALRLLDQSPVPVRAHCLLLMEPTNRIVTPDWMNALAELQARTMANGIAQLQTQEQGAYNLVAELAHNFTIEEALWRAYRTMPLLSAYPALIEMSRIERYVERVSTGLSKKVYALEMGYEAYGLDLKPGPHPAPRVAERLRMAIQQPRIFDQERLGATLAMRIQQAKPHIPPGYVGAVNEIDWTSNVVEEARSLQLNVRDELGKASRQFVLGSGYEFEVWIGRERGMFEGAVFPDQDLPPLEEQGYMLTVSLSAQGFLRKPIVKTIFLPKAGESTRCSFSVGIEAELPRFEGRLTIAYQNRILQTYLVTGSVLGVDGAENEPIDLRLEMNVQNGWSGLADQSRIGSALVLNFQAGEKGGTGLAGYNQLAFSLEGLQSVIDLVEGKIGGSKWDQEEFKGLRAKGTEKLLVYLAKHGHDLLDGIKSYAKDDKGGQAVLNSLLSAKSIQVLAANEGARLPIEFFYSYGSPDDDATLCPSAERRSQAGWCPECAKGSGKYVCPSGFWALQKVIEWHSFEESKKRTDELGSRSFAIEDRNGFVRQMLWGSEPRAVVGASKKVDQVEAGSYTAMLEKLKGFVTTQTVDGWTQWGDRIKDSPELLVLVPHTEKNDFDEACLEIWGERLAAGKIKAGYVKGPASAPGPVVLLLGCNTDNLDVAFRSFPIKFANAGAAVVVSTISYLLGRHATRLAAALVEEMVNASGKGDQSFGELMLNVRRKWLLTGEPPISLSLKAYGDARWRL